MRISCALFVFYGCTAQKPDTIADIRTKERQTDMDKKEFKNKLAENEYENINVLQLFGLQDDVYVGGSIEVFHKPCGHTDCVIFKQGIYEDAVRECIDDYCSECRRRMDNTAEFTKGYIEWLYVDAVCVPDNMEKSKVVKSKSYSDFFKSNINLEKFARNNYKKSNIDLMKEIDEYISKNSTHIVDESGRTVTPIKIDRIRNRITHFRMLSSVSRKELAERTGIAFKTIENYELGRTKLTSISVENALKIADVFGIRVEYMV